MYLDFKRGNSNLASLFVDSDHYLQINEDVRIMQKDPVQHFMEYGFSEGRPPSKWFNRTYLERIAKPLRYDLSTATKLIESLLDAGSDHHQWASPCLSPAWMLRQLPKTRSIRDALRNKVPEKGISIHPALRKIYPSSDFVYISDLISNLDKIDYASLSLIDLEEYKHQHKDVRSSLVAPFQIFEQLWNIGYLENRLKYLGVQRKSQTDPDTLLRSNFAAILSERVGLGEQSSPRILNGLGQSLHLFDQESAYFKPLTNFNQDRLNAVPTFEEIYDIGLNVNLARAVPRLTAPEVQVTARITDMDLVANRVKSSGSRVVYAMSTNGHDGIPTPPDLDDCDFFLFSDIAGLPKNSPWQLVTPTLSDRDAKRASLWFKTHPHLLFPDARFVTWIDANVVCMPGSEKVLVAHEAMSEIATFVHGDRRCVYDEADAIRQRKLDYAPVIDRAVQRLNDASVPKDLGLYETNVLFSRCEDFLVREFFDEWWRNIWLGSRRDQMSFTMALWLTKLSVSPLDGPFSTKNSRFFSKVPHRKTASRTVGGA